MLLSEAMTGERINRKQTNETRRMRRRNMIGTKLAIFISYLAKVAAIREFEEEAFNNQYKIDESRLVRVTQEAEIKHQSTHADLQSSEWVTVFIYLISDEEKEKITYQLSEVEPSGCAWVTFQEEKARYEENPDRYAAAFARIFSNQELYSRVVNAANTSHDNGGSQETYGKDFAEIATYFGNDLEKTRQALLSWQKEFKDLGGQDKTLVQLTTFKDDQHKDGTEYFLVTDENGNYLTDEAGNYITRPRDLCHIDGTWHKSVLVAVVDKEGRFLRQQRSLVGKKR